MKHFLKRTGAYFVDCTLCYVFVMLVIQWALLGNIRDSIGISNEWFETSINLQIYVLLTISLPVWLYFIYFDSKKSTGTYGKRLFKIKVSDIMGDGLGFGKSTARTFAKLLPWELAHFGLIFPTPIYFETDPNIRLLTILALVLLISYAVSIIINSKGQSMYDKLLGTRVVDK